MGSMLPWWLLIAPAILVILDSMMSSKTSSMSGAAGTGGRTDGTMQRTAAH